ncbi:hypothetical protein PT974_00156 [Cladobotryum mycophilum]|uniref:Protein ZIP4 homolog n=1 Tax=Cladobotryum mycophilum TaxID=491253 RepID=A0ABR0T036_9HYPO
MAPSDPIAVGRLRKLRSEIEFAVDLHSKLPETHDARAIDLLLAETSHHVQTVKTLSQPNGNAIPRQTARDLEKQGRNLWNLSLRLKRDELEATVPREKNRLLVRARLFGFQLLELGRGTRGQKREAESDMVYLISLAITLGRLCLGDSDLESTRLVLQKAAEYVEALKSMPVSSSSVGGEGARRKLEAEYLAMRTVLSWKEDRLDVAEHMFSKTDTLRQTLDVPSAEIIADTLQHIGFDLSSKGDSAMAVKWLKRAHEIISRQALDQLSTHGLELRLAICQGLVRGLLDIGSQESVQEAGDLIAYVESEIGDKPVVLHWRLELLQKSPDEVFDIDAYASLLRRMIRSFDFSDGTFHFLLHHIKELRERSSRLARGLLDELLLQHILQSTKTDWLNKIVVRRIWMSTMETGSVDESMDASADVKNLLDTIHDTLSEPLKPDVAGAAHSLIWKKIEALLAKNSFGVAEGWCLVALHAILMSSGDANLGKFHRKLLICALGLNDAEKARSAFYSMSKISQNHILTRYLMFKVSLLSWDHELGRESIEQLSKATDKDQGRDLLYACIREAQKDGDKICTLTALKAISENWAVGEASGGNLPSVLRCAIRLIHLMEDQEGATDTHDYNARFAEDLCKLFEKAAEHAKSDPKDAHGNRIFTVEELHWFRKNAYNIGATRLEQWELRYTIRIFRNCLTFKDSYPDDLPLSDVTEIILMAMRCHFAIAAALVAIARTEDKVDEQLQRYLEARHHIVSFDNLLQTEVGSQEKDIIQDLVAKLSTLFVFDFEAAIHLKNWDDLSHIVRKAKLCRDEVMYKAMGDCLLRSQAPGKVMFASMRLIINEIFELEEFDHEKLAKYIRCMFQVILPLDEGSAFQLVEQALQIAREGKDVAKRFPDTELEWLVATVFNHAIDYYARGDEDHCHRWALKAMDLAEYVDEGSGLRNSLQTKFAKLRFGGPSGRQTG